MKFTEKFRTTFEEHLKLNKFSFKEESHSFVKSNFDNPSRCMFGLLCVENNPFKLDYQIVNKVIEKSFEDPTIFNLQLRNQFSYMHSAFFNNEVKFNISIKFPINFDDHYWDCKSKLEDLDYDCEAEYWEKFDNIEWYEAIADFSCFLDIKIPVDQLGKYKEIGDRINVDAWLSYLKDLLRLFFPEFAFSEKFSTRKTLRFLKPLNNNVYLGFEYDESQLKKKYQNGDLEFPEYFNLILINNNLKKTIKKEDYIFQYSEDIISLGILGNPLFFNGCRNLSRFGYLDRIYEKGNPQNTTFKYFREYVKINNEELQIVHTKGIGEKMKKHAFFYIDLISTSSKSYLTFLEENIMNAIKVLP